MAIATVRYRSSNMTVGRIDKITFKAQKPTGPYSSAWVPCKQHEAQKYTITVEVYQTTGAWYDKKRTTTLQNVDHVVKLDDAGKYAINMVNP